jgi:hypothetical protein
VLGDSLEESWKHPQVDREKRKQLFVESLLKFYRKERIDLVAKNHARGCQT